MYGYCPRRYLKMANVLSVNNGSIPSLFFRRGESPTLITTKQIYPSVQFTCYSSKRSIQEMSALIHHYSNRDLSQITDLRENIKYSSKLLAAVPAPPSPSTNTTTQTNFEIFILSCLKKENQWNRRAIFLEEDLKIY